MDRAIVTILQKLERALRVFGELIGFGTGMVSFRCDDESGIAGGEPRT
jgi:hypothetical protein